MTSYLRALRETANRGNVPTFNPDTARFENSPGVNRTTGVLDVYIDPVGGNDENNGTLTAPIQTLLELDARIPLIVDHPVRVHLKSGVYLLPDRGWWLSSRWLRSGYIRVYADEAWDSAVYTVIATDVAESGTGQEVVVASGLTTNAWQNKTIEFVSGAASGYRQDVMSNDTTDIIPSAGWDTISGVAIPAAGDNFRIFDADGCELRLPEGGPTGGQYGGNYLLAQHMVGGDEGSLQAIDNEIQGVLVFEGVTFGATDIVNSWRAVAVQGDFVIVFGVTGGSTAYQNPFYVESGLVWAGFGSNQLAPNAGLQIHRQYRGWGFRCTQRAPWVRSHARIDAFLNMEAVGAPIEMDPLARYDIRGGRVGRIRGVADQAVVRFYPDTFSGQPRMNADVVPSLWMRITFVLLQQYVQIAHTAIRMSTSIIIDGPSNLVLIAGDGSTTIEHSTPGAVVLELVNGGTLAFTGDPTGLGDSTPSVPVLDWSVDGVAPRRVLRMWV